jgi:hypothetical protein
MKCGDGAASLACLYRQEGKAEVAVDHEFFANP